MTRFALRPSAFLLLALAACSKTDPAPTPSASTSPSTVTAAVDAAPPVAAAITWTGAYKSTAGTIHVPPGPEWAGTKWRGDESPDGLGDGTLTLTVDPKSGKVTGAIDGPVGPGVLYGSFAGEQLTATLARKDATDNGLAGALLANVVGEKLEGVIHATSWDAHTIRSISFSLGKK